MGNATEVVSGKPQGSRSKRHTAADSRTRRFFISYRRSESESSGLANFLAKQLQAAGHDVFIDVNMPVGTDWVAEIGRRIEWCDYLIVLLSEGSRTSEMVQGEVRLAHQRRKRDGKPEIIPIRVRYEGTLDYELDSYLYRLQRITWSKESDSETILNEIVERAKKEANVVEPTKDRMPPVSPPDTHRPQPRVDPRYVTAPGGTVGVEDPFYIPRRADAKVSAAAESGMATTITIKGPRQMGKSSLLIRYMAKARAHGREVCFLDFAEYSDDQLVEYPRLLGLLTDHFAETLGTDPPSAPPMQQRQLTKYFEQQVLARKTGEIVLAFDEVDRIYGRSYQSDFFTLLRLWHNKRAEHPGWKRVSIALAISTEPYLLIKAADRSPFNVSEQIEAEPFTLDACKTCNELYGSPLTNAQVEELHDLFNGQPYLTRLAFHRLSGVDAMSFRTLQEDAAKPDGPFSDHLSALLLKLGQQPDLLNALQQLIVNRTQPTQDVSDRLKGAGLISRNGNGAKPSNMVYALFFKRVLK